MSNNPAKDTDYDALIREGACCNGSMLTEAYFAVYREMLAAFWNVGKGLYTVADYEVRRDVMGALADDLLQTVPGTHLATNENIWKMWQFYKLYRNVPENERKILSFIPWSYHREIIDAGVCVEGDTTEIAMRLVQAILEEDWTLSNLGAVTERLLDLNSLILELSFLTAAEPVKIVYEGERKHMYVHMPEPGSELERAMMGDPYLLEFISAISNNTDGRKSNTESRKTSAECRNDGTAGDVCGENTHADAAGGITGGTAGSIAGDTAGSDADCMTDSSATEAAESIEDAEGEGVSSV